MEKYEKELISEIVFKVSLVSFFGVGIYNFGDKRMNKLVIIEEIRRNEKKLVFNMVFIFVFKFLSNNLNIGKIILYCFVNFVFKIC